MKKYNVAILGATGAVGQEFINLIEERNFPFSGMKLLASARSAGKKLKVAGQEYTVEEATPESFADLCFIPVPTIGASVTRRGTA